MKNILAFIFCVALLSACKTLVPFTQDLKSQHNWSKTDLQKIQFYLSNDVILHRQLLNSETAIQSGKIKMVNGKKVEEIIIRKGTPGVLTTNSKGKKMSVSFEIDDAHHLNFGTFSKKKDNKFYLVLDDYKKNEWYKVDYYGKSYYVSPQSLRSFLMIDMRKINKEENKQRIAGGRKL